LSRTPRGDDGQTVGIYIVAISALFFLAFAYFAVGQASVTRSSAQTAADAAALAAARADRDAVHDAFLAALTAGDVHQLDDLLQHLGTHGDRACGAADTYAADNDADAVGCDAVDNPPGHHVTARSLSTVGKSVVNGTENIHAKAEATAVVRPRCTTDGKDGDLVRFLCNGDEITVDPKSDGFTLDLSTFYTVQLSK
jgi:hypothetical protein